MFKPGEIIRAKLDHDNEKKGLTGRDWVVENQVDVDMISLEGVGGGWLIGRFELVPQNVDTADAAAYYHAITQGELT